MSRSAPIAVVAGEASGDQLGAALIESIRRRDPARRFIGVAGPAMRAAGCEAWYDTEDLSVMGLAEVLRHLPRLVRIRNGLLRRLRAERPAAYVGIDAPDFNLRLAPQLRAAGMPTVQYVCPQVWAWRSGRLRLLREAFDEVLCLLPFEVALLEAAGVRASFVGHPFADQIPGHSDPGEARQRLGIEASRVISLLPGSRAAEVMRLGPPFLQAAARLQRQWPDAAFVSSMANRSLHELFSVQMREHAPGLEVRLFDRRARDVMAAADALLVASGTATLETMLVNRPMVVAYRLAPLTYWLARTLKLVEVPHFAMPNLLAGERLVPELLQAEATGERLAAEVTALLGSAATMQVLARRFSAIGCSLRRDASARAAERVLAIAG